MTQTPRRRCARQTWIVATVLDVQWQAAKPRHPLPFHRVPEHNDEAGIGLQGVDEVLDKEGRLPVCGVVIEIHPSIVVPHGGCTGFSWGKKRNNTILNHAKSVHIFVVFPPFLTLHFGFKAADWLKTRSGQSKTITD